MLGLMVIIITSEDLEDIMLTNSIKKLNKTLEDLITTLNRIHHQTQSHLIVVPVKTVKIEEMIWNTQPLINLNLNPTFQCLNTMKSVLVK